MQNRGYRGEQWSECARCGFDYPMSRLKWDTGYAGTLLLCARCIDNKTIEHHQERVAKALQSKQTEGADLRFVDATLANSEVY